MPKTELDLAKPGLGDDGSEAMGVWGVPGVATYVEEGEGMSGIESKVKG